MTRTLSSRTLRTVAAGLTLLIALTACTTAQPATPPRPALPRHATAAQLADAVSARVAADRTAKLAMSGTIDGSAPTGLDVVGVMRIEPAGISSRFTETVTTADGTRDEAEYIALPDTAYVRSTDPAVDAAWRQIDFTTRSEDAARDAAVVRTITDSMDPTRNLLRYTEATEITAADDTDVNGVPAVRYTLRVDLAKAAAGQTDPQRRAALERQLRDGITGIPFTLWVDERDRPLRTQARLELPGAGTFGMTATYAEWGAPVEITAPPPGEFA